MKGVGQLTFLKNLLCGMTPTSTHEQVCCAAHTICQKEQLGAYLLWLATTPKGQPLIPCMALQTPSAACQDAEQHP